MRWTTAMLMALAYGCGATDGPLYATKPGLPLEALATARIAAASYNVALTSRAIDPSIAADLAVMEDDGCVVTATDPSPVVANTNDYSVTTTYKNCDNGVVASVTGTRAVHVTVDDASNKAALTSALYLSFVSSDSVLQNLDADTSVAHDGNSKTRTYTTTGAWTTPSAAAGKTQNFNDTFTLQDVYDSATELPVSTTMQGAYASFYEGSHQGFTVTYTDILLNYTDCCLPLGGSISAMQVFADGSAATTTWTFTDTCGAIRINGAANAVYACP